MQIPYSPVLPGETLAGKYRIERVLGSGGMGVILAARHLELQQRVAVKILTTESNAEHFQRFLAEASIAASICSDHVVRIFDFGRTEAGAPYLVMEYLEGENLQQVLARGGPVAAPLAVSWALQMCEGLAHAHAVQVVHRDLKPANVFLEQRAGGSLRIRLLDFGVARQPDAERPTVTGQILGSLRYMAPEQILDARAVDARSDVWGLGVVLYELLTGEPAFKGDSLFALAAHIKDVAPVPIRALRPELPAGLSAVVERCLRKQREERWLSVSALAHALLPFAPEGGAGLARSIADVLSGMPGDPTLDVGAQGRRASASSSSVDALWTSPRSTRPRRNWLLWAAAVVSGSLAILVVRATQVQSSRAEGELASLQASAAAPVVDPTPLPDDERTLAGGPLPPTPAAPAREAASPPPSSQRRTTTGPLRAARRQGGAAAQRKPATAASDARDSAEAELSTPTQGPLGPLPIDRGSPW